MDWLTFIIQVLTLLFTGGGLLAIVLVSEKKTAANLENFKTALDNMNKVNEQYGRIINIKDADIERVRQELREKDAALETKDRKIDFLYQSKSDLQSRLDDVNTECAIAKLTNCKIIACPQRKPPLSETEDVFNTMREGNDRRDSQQVRHSADISEDRNREGRGNPEHRAVQRHSDELDA